MYLIDTNVASEPSKPAPNPQVVAWLEAHEDSIFLSAVTIQELQSGVSRLPEGKRKWKLQKDFDDARLAYQESIMAFDHDVALVAGQLEAELEAKGTVLHLADLIIAATARFHSLTIVTGDKAFAHAGLPTINPWEVPTTE